MHSAYTHYAIDHTTEHMTKKMIWALDFSMLMKMPDLTTPLTIIHSFKYHKLDF